jgi:hypothetical protein
MVLNIKQRWLIIAVLVCLLLAGASTTAAVTAKQPNLVALPAEDVRLEVNGATQTLRFSTLSWNNGAGPVEIEGGEVIGGDKQKVTQNIYNDAGGSDTHHAGDFVYHDGHNHIHFEGYATYILQPVEANGQANRIGQKTSFCLMDTDRINHRLDGASKKAQYTTCSGTVQGISVGWGDKYGYQLEGQEIDVTDLPDGDYRLIIEINPQRHLIESDYTDNVSEVIVRIENGSASIVTDEEPSEPGNGNGNGRGGGRPS